MCGFNGLIGQYNKNDLKLVKEKSKLIEHRGPDEHTFLEKNNIYIDFFRLSIVDLPSGSQPKTDKDGNYTLFFNGEIYNFKILKKELIDLGVNFETNSDTEVLLQIFNKFGIAGLKKLNGMFSICLIDNINNFTYLIRDQFGIKPLYYKFEKNYIKFSSESKTLFSKSQSLSQSSLGHYLSYQFYLNNETIFENIYTIDPGCYLKIDNKTGKNSIESYFNLKFLNTSSQHTNLIDLEKEIINSVKLQTFADVSVGSHLSGGIDSSLISAIASSYKSDLKTFHGYFPDDGEDYSEIDFARKVAKHIDVELFEVEITYQDFIDNFSKIMNILDYPIVGPGVFPQYMVNKFASKHVKVLLGGQGGDEIFAGYARYLIVYLEQVLLGSINESQDSKHLVNLDTVSKALPSLKEYIPLIKEMWSQDLFTNPVNRYEMILKRNIPVKWLTTHSQNLIKSAKQDFEKQLNFINEASLINKMLNFDISFILPGLLQVEDRVSMAHSIESRVPYLDQQVFDCAVNLEPKLKFGEGVLKSPLKEIAKKYLPEYVYNRKGKMGFPVPFNEWLNKPEFKEFVFNTILNSNFSNSVYFNKRNFEKDTMTYNNFDRSLWAVLCLSEWSKNVSMELENKN